MAGAKGKHSRLSQDVVQSIRDLIVSQNLDPGDKLPSERKLIDQLGLSRGPIREALRVLEIMGVVEVRPRSGIYVREPQAGFFIPVESLQPYHKDTLFHHHEARIVIEPGMASMAALRASTKEMEAIRQSFENLKACHHNSDITGAYLFDGEFHWRISKASHNPALIMLMNVLSRSLYAGWRSTEAVLVGADGQNELEAINKHLSGILGGQLQDSDQIDIVGRYLFSGWKARFGAAASSQVNIEEHEAILLSLESRDPEGASRAMRMHLARGLRELQSDLSV